MKTNRALLIAVIAMSALCAALGWSSVVTANRARELKAQLEAKDAEMQKLAVKKRGHSTTPAATDLVLGQMLARRDAEYQELQEAYDKLRQQIPSSTVVNITPASTSAVTRAGFGPPFSRRNGSNFLERIRLQDPERYKQVMQQMQQRQQQAAQEFDDQMAGLVARAQTAATPDEADLVNQITDTLDKINELRQSRQALADLPDDQRQAQMQPINDQLREAYTQLNELRNQDRTLQLQNLATQLGLKSSDSQNLVDGVAQVYKNTSYQPQRGPGGPGGPGGQGFFGGGGGTSGPQPTTPQPPQSPTTKQ
jgi:hypothetical protein